MWSVLPGTHRGRWWSILRDPMGGGSGRITFWAHLIASHSCTTWWPNIKVLVTALVGLGKSSISGLALKSLRMCQEGTMAEALCQGAPCRFVAHAPPPARCRSAHSRESSLRSVPAGPRTAAHSRHVPVSMGWAVSSSLSSLCPHGMIREASRAQLTPP